MGRGLSGQMVILILSNFRSNNHIVGEDHRRQRGILLPGFGPQESKAFMPVFLDCAESISIKWLEAIGSGSGQSVVINVISWLSRGALDAFGHGMLLLFPLEYRFKLCTISIAAFDVQLGTIQDESHPLAKKYNNYLSVFSQFY